MAMPEGAAAGSGKGVRTASQQCRDYSREHIAGTGGSHTNVTRRVDNTLTGFVSNHCPSSLEHGDAIKTLCQQERFFDSIGGTPKFTAFQQSF